MRISSITCLFLVSLIGSTFLQGCKSSDPTPVANYDIPTTYNFTNVDYSDPAKRLVMIAQIETLLNSGNKAGGGTNIDGTKLENMFINANNPFTADSLNKSGLQLKDQAITSAQSVLEGYLSSQATISQSTTPASKGTAGVGTTKAITYILLTDKGANNRQLFTKTVMGVLLSHQIITLVNSSPDNTTVVAGKGTAMEHAWDQAFGYLNVPKDFPTNVTGLKYLGSYSNQVDAGLGSNATLMNAFLKGRAAISNKDMTTKKAQADIITKELEMLAAAAAIHEIGEARASLDDDIQRVSRFSECMGFILSLKYFDNRVITDAQHDKLINTYLHGGQLYDITTDDMNNIVSTLTSIYGFTNPDKI